MVSYPKKALKLPRALKTAAKLPVLVGKGQNRSAQAPKPGEEPIVMLRVQILGCIDVLAKDKGGTSDP
jgi:phosphatidylserine decarboxylase